jgi:hypothetical protein
VPTINTSELVSAGRLSPELQASPTSYLEEARSALPHYQLISDKVPYKVRDVPAVAELICSVYPVGYA